MPSIKIRKTSVLLLILVLGISFAAGKSLTREDKAVWLNSGADKLEIGYSCGNLESLKFSSRADSDPITLTEIDDSGNFTTEFFRRKDFGAGDYNVTLRCSNPNSSVTKEISLKNLSVNTGRKGKAFFGGKTTWGEFTRPVEIGFKVENGKFKKGKLDIEARSSYVGVESYNSDEEALVLNFNSNYNPDSEEVGLKIIYQDGDVNTSLKVPVEVYSWKTVFKGENPGRKLDYRSLDSLKYNFDVRKAKGVSGTLYEEDFVVSIEKAVSGETVYSEKQWMETSESSNVEYSISLGNIPDLDTGKYDFRFSIMKNGDKVPIDSLRVVKSLQFEGQVRDSKERPVKTRMTLVQDKRTVPVVTGSDGVYSKQIRGDQFKRIDLKFFDRGRQAPDTSLTLRKVELGTAGSSLSSEAIKYQYWENPPVSVPGLDPVNMMAVKFGHSIKGGADATVAFDPSNINPENLEVFRCSSWNFQGRECMSNWRKIDDSRKSISYTNWNVNIQDLELHHISQDVGGVEKDILLNAYIIGTSSELGLEGQDAPLSINKRRVRARGNLRISGKVIGSNGKYVEDATVTIKLTKNGSAVKKFKVESGDQGEFVVEGTAPSDAGEYRIEVSIEKNPYEPFSTESASTIEVYYRKAMELENPEKDSIRLGTRENISFKLENTGQVEIDSLDTSLEGLGKSLYSLHSAPSTLKPGETSRLKYSIEIPRSYCPYPCGQPPSFTVKVEGSALDQSVRAMSTVFTSVDKGVFNETKNKTALRDSESEGFVSEVSAAVVGPTGSFLKRQSSVNIALGLIMIFTMVLAVAVKKRNTNDASRNRFGDQKAFQSYSSQNSFSSGRPGPDSTEQDEDTGGNLESNVSSSNSDGPGSGWRKYGADNSNDDFESGDDSSGDRQNEEENDQQNGKFVCEETGESFDTKAALKMHKKINGID
ncbi:MAG: hypothetical protein ABEK10_00560 [Candidatus Nanosalina sp.]